VKTKRKAKRTRAKPAASRRTKAAAKVEAAPPGTITRRELAELLGVHAMTVTKWERDGLPIAHLGRKGKPSRYRPADARAWLAAREEAAKTGGIADVARERARKERAQAVLSEQTYQARALDLLPRAEVEKAWSAEVAAVRAKLLALPQTLADRVFRAGTLEGLEGVERVLEDAVRDTLRELSDPGRDVEESAERSRRSA
jgi:phage terminase Nu1 subunit (DNA packaging protein)